MTTPDPTPPDATATPECDELVSEGRAHYMSLALARSLEKRLTAAKAEIARLNSHEGDLVIGCAIVEGARRQEARAVDRLEADSAALGAEVEQLRAQLRERTQWQCACGGTDCAGIKENERLRAEVERLGQNLAAIETAGGDEGASARMAMETVQLRDRVAELEAFLNRVAAQRPSKPDYWNSCGQCESNSDDAKELLDAARDGKGAT